MASEYLIRLPWPPAKTSPNASQQGDYRGKARAARSYKATCAKECWAQSVRRIDAEGHVPVEITYCPPRNGRLDWDNISKRAKQGFDAVSEAIGVDDGRWWPVTLRLGEPVEGGAVLLHFKPADNWQSIGDLAKDMVKGTIE